MPAWLPTFTKSPIEIWSSTKMNKPVIISFTKVCAPKPTANPTTPAPANNGAIFKPSSERVTMITSTTKTTNIVVRIRGNKVRVRADNRSSFRARYLSMIALVISQSATVISNNKKTVNKLLNTC